MGWAFTGGSDYLEIALKNYLTWRTPDQDMPDKHARMYSRYAVVVVPPLGRTVGVASASPAYAASHPKSVTGASPRPRRACAAAPRRVAGVAATCAAGCGRARCRAPRWCGNNATEVAAAIASTAVPATTQRTRRCLLDIATGDSPDAGAVSSPRFCRSSTCPAMASASAASSARPSRG